MKRFTAFFWVMSAFFLAIDSTAAERPRYTDSDFSVIHGGNLEMSKTASRDTVFLIGPWGSGAVVNGQFQDPSGSPDWGGWTSIDLTQNYEPIWHVDTYNVVSGVYSAWCGDISYYACVPEDPVGGYGSNYDELLSWYGNVGNPGVSTTVDITATLNHNTEPGYDYSCLGYYKANSSNIFYLWNADGVGEQVPISRSVTYEAGEYVGEAGNQVRITWQVTSDGGWDDSDCLYYGDGALQIDDITVTLTNDGFVTSIFDDFEDGTLGPNWVLEFTPGVGDYAHLLVSLNDEDPCSVNSTPQTCFIADNFMLLERGLPVEYCQDWCYGPGGFIVTTSGGAAGPDYHIHNAIQSPAIPWPESGYEGLKFFFDVYEHEDLSADSPGIFWTWGLRSTASDNPADIEDAGFSDRSFVYYGGPSYRRYGGDMTDLMVPDRKFVQARLAVYKLGYVWGWVGNDGTPAPYFDNVNLSCFDRIGPGMAARELDLAQDAFPADGQIHTGVDMNLNHVRFDMAGNVSLPSDLRNDPGDSIVVDIVAARTGSVLVENDIDALVKAPRLHWTLKSGISVDVAWRTNLDAAGGQVGRVDVNGNLYGEVQGDVVVFNDIPRPGKWMFDLPDVGFLFPGDVLHYFIEAWDDVEGDYQKAVLPATLAGYGDFSNPLAYNSSFVVHALPTLFDDSGEHPPILFWNDSANRGGQDEWHNAFANLGFGAGSDYDIFYTNAPTSSVGNGLGGRASYGQLYGYETMVYTCGDLGFNTISNLDYQNDAGDDIGVVDDWLSQGGKNLFASGDGLVSDLNQSGTSTQAFITNYMGVSYLSSDVRPMLGGDTAPSVFPVPGNSVFQTTDSWIAFGGCRYINTFDAVSTNNAEQLALFNDGTSGLAAATKFVAPNGSEVIYIPYGFKFIRTPPTLQNKIYQPSPLPARARLLDEILSEFGHLGPFFPCSVDLPNKKFTTGAYPNPFNPVTKIEYTMPHTGHLSLKIFNIRGEVVRTLINEDMAEGPGFKIWDGTNDQGQSLSSGVYFYEARTAGKVQVDKITLLK
ncbi:MAG: T9SS type A sorting domain-containing protein [Gemmatimonadales bacterium]|nr:T9SS type A sorting domain-containing protein [Gemmatimonadales bacterium]